MALYELLDSILAGMGYELVEVEQSAPGKLLRVFVDKQEGGVTIDDCVAISNHLNRLLTVEGIDYSRLEISSPGLDRPLRKESDFARFMGKRVKVKLRIAMQGQKNFAGFIREINNGVLELEVEGRRLQVELDNLDKARLVPEI
ncbi:MAG TPA: ribosome maturation factor RimP [Nitrosomonas nitrosa]|jgi:ribosome maturation factor RimP|uniref:Ribosome maturation factor RimP n=1 Tax=Nitrosomonas nitrosa TaxID=52442 RepID=A0A1I4M4Z6_9PROT|nr:ribosome maturation factor RimP [Nitrosomonas nitrosa]MCO6433497.1 ribosome maturation factor RimP [Nitrosomonas nitrosa]PTQ92308.1 ribosome maturation factor RimP [Nitrosomonas nitrosa]CAE6484683.1 Ribosome maturation factor RimP [Nitrosomonas nitrosa]SFL98226.1 ribosome maturation factor RimP [Nitrosomonas nitrosa]HBZ29523.1 ribosome maturation factor RimP [Nitrosomonas nitrosa]